MPLVAASIIFLALTKSKVSDQDMESLAAVCDFYRRLAMIRGGRINLLAEISQLSAMAHHIKHSDAQSMGA